MKELFLFTYASVTWLLALYTAIRIAGHLIDFVITKIYK